MRVASLGVARPMYWDRNATTTTGGYYNAVAPHASTTRWTITNTASQKMFVDSGSIAIMRYTAAGTVAEAVAAIQSPVTQSILLAIQYGNTVGQTQQSSMGGSVYVKPGDSLVGISFDNGTGGTVLYAIFAHAVQYDA